MSSTSSFATARRVLPLQTEIDPESASVRRSISLEVSDDGLTVALVQFDASRQGFQQEYRVEIAMSELIDLIRIHGVDNQLMDSHGFRFEGVG